MNHESQEPTQMTLRLPPELRDWLAAKSAANQRTRNGEIVYILLQAQKAETESATAKE